MKVDLYKQSGEKSGTLELPKEIFEIPFNKDLVHQALEMQLGNRRKPIAHTLNKAEVRGSGKKPFRQKGTGHARQGNLRNPHMPGGGVSFGPRNTRNFVVAMPKKQRRKALFCALSEKARKNQIIALEEFKISKPKTRDFAALIKKLPIEKDVLIVLPARDEKVQKSSRNIAHSKTIIANFVNIHDLQRFEKVLIFKDAVAKMKELFLAKTEK